MAGRTRMLVGLAVASALACGEPLRHPSADETSTSAADAGESVAATSGGATSGGAESTAETRGASTSATTIGTDTTGAGVTTTGTDATGADPVEEAIMRGVEGTTALSGENIVLLLLMDVMHRRFSVGEFATASAQYDATIEARAQPPIDAYAFRRIFDPAQVLTASELDAIAPGVNRVTVPALFCDTLPLPDDYATRLQTEAGQGGYGTTHVALALFWLDELGCASPLDASFRDQIVGDTFALIDTEDGVGDLELEAALFGTLLDGPDSLPAELVDLVVAAQLFDGTWPHDPGGTTGAWHTTGLALFLLLELHREPLDTFVAMD